MIPRLRAWHKTWEEMGKVKRIRFDDEGNVTTVLFRGRDLGTNTHADEIELMQSTGLFDKNGKEIFEGDILGLEAYEELLNASVFRDEEYPLFAVELKKYNYKIPLFELFKENLYQFGVIGNIYENPELLEEKK